MVHSLFSVVFFGVKLRPSHFKDEHRLRVFENRTFTKIFRPKKEEVTGG
jgi:hypothetical protein